MAKKKTSTKSKTSTKTSTKISIGKATTVKVPTIKSYKPSNSVVSAKNQLSATEKAKPAAYTSQYGDKITSMAADIANRKGFSYDFTKDALYQNYKDQYTRQAQLGAQNVTAQAAALSGGYGNSYAATAGNLAYQENMAQLNNVIPSLYEAAYNRYNMDLDNKRADLSMYQGLEDTDYSRYRDNVQDWQSDRDYYAGRYDSAYNNDFNKYTSDVSNRQWKYQQKNENAQWRQQQDASNYWNKKELDSSNHWNQKDYELSRAAASAKAAASKKSSSKKKEIDIPADVRAKIREYAKDDTFSNKEKIINYLNNMEKAGVLTANQSDYVWSVILGYTQDDFPEIEYSDEARALASGTTGISSKSGTKKKSSKSGTKKKK